MGDVVVRTRVVLAALTAGPVLVTVLLALGLPDAPRPLASLSSAAALLGLLAAPVAWRVHLAQRERAGKAADAAERDIAFFRSRLIPATVTEGAALLGGIAYALTREPWAVAGIVTHVFVLGALWPRESAREELEAPYPGARGDVP